MHSRSETKDELASVPPTLHTFKTVAKQSQRPLRYYGNEAVPQDRVLTKRLAEDRHQYRPPSVAKTYTVSLSAQPPTNGAVHTTEVSKVSKMEFTKPSSISHLSWDQGEQEIDAMTQAWDQDSWAQLRHMDENQTTQQKSDDTYPLAAPHDRYEGEFAVHIPSTLHIEPEGWPVQEASWEDENGGNNDNNAEHDRETVISSE